MQSFLCVFHTIKIFAPGRTREHIYFNSPCSNIIVLPFIYSLVNFIVMKFTKLLI